jgi:phosphoribosylamine-glycine ligase
MLLCYLSSCWLRILQVMEEIVLRTAHAMVSEGCPFRGVLFAGLMIKNGKAKLLEHNVRFGDPECQGLMARLDSDLLAALMQVSCQQRLATAGWDVCASAL